MIPESHSPTSLLPPQSKNLEYPQCYVASDIAVPVILKGDIAAVLRDLLLISSFTHSW